MNRIAAPRPLLASGIFATALATSGVLLVSTVDPQAGARLSLLMVGAAALLFVAIAVRWEHIIIMVVFWLIFEAIPRRYLVNDPSITIFKDLLLATAYAKGLRALWNRREWHDLRASPSIWLCVLLLLLWGAVEAANPLLPGPAVAAVGVRAWFWYLPLLLLAQHCFGSKAGLLGFLRWFVLLAIPLCLLGVAQALAGPSSILSRNYLDFEITYPAPGDIPVIRAMSTFASNGVFAQYLLFATLLGFALLQMRSSRLNTAARVAVPSALALGMVSNAGSTVPFLSLLLLPTMAVAGGLTRRAVRWVLPVMLALAVTVPTAWVVSPTTVGGAINRVISPVMLERNAADSSSHNLLDRVASGLGAAGRTLEDKPLGHGLGSASLGTQYVVGGRQRAAELASVEGGYARIAWETGWIGIAIFLLFEAAILHQLLRTRSAVKDPDLRWLALACAACHIGTLGWLVFASTIDSALFAILLWFFTGIGLGLRRWDNGAL